MRDQAGPQAVTVQRGSRVALQPSGPDTAVLKPPNFGNWLGHPSRVKSSDGSRMRIGIPCGAARRNAPVCCFRQEAHVPGSRDMLERLHMRPATSRAAPPQGPQPPPPHLLANQCFPATQAPPPLGNSAARDLEGVGDLISSAAGVLDDAIPGLVGDALGNVGGAVGGMIDTVEDGVDTVVDGVTNAVLETLPGPIQDGVREAWETITNGRKCYGSIKKGVRIGGVLAGGAGAAVGAGVGILVQWDDCVKAVESAVDTAGSIVSTVSTSKSSIVCMQGTWAVQSVQVSAHCTHCWLAAAAVLPVPLC